MKLTRANFPALFDRSVRTGLDGGCFGAISPYWCEDCGSIWREPEYEMTHRQTLESPEEGECYCRDCGSSVTGEREPGEYEGFSVVRRYKINRKMKGAA